MLVLQATQTTKDHSEHTVARSNSTAKKNAKSDVTAPATLPSVVVAAGGGPRRRPRRSNGVAGAVVAAATLVAERKRAAVAKLAKTRSIRKKKKTCTRGRPRINPVSPQADSASAAERMTTNDEDIPRAAPQTTRVVAAAPSHRATPNGVVSTTIAVVAVLGLVSTPLAEAAAAASLPQWAFAVDFMAFYSPLLVGTTFWQVSECSAFGGC